MAEKKSIINIFKKLREGLEVTKKATEEPKPITTPKPKGMPPTTYDDYVKAGGIWTKQEWEKNRKK